MKQIFAVIGSVLLFMISLNTKATNNTINVDVDQSEISKADACRNCGGGHETLRSPPKDS